MKFKVRRVHFVGIGGAGMSGIAEVLLNQGFEVSGSDAHASATTQRLVELSAKVHIGHSATHVENADAVVISTAIKEDNPELVAAKARGIPVVPRALMLAELMRMKSGIAIAGTHGKTTTTSLVASVLAQGGLDPTFVIGGKLVSAQVNARLGKGEFLVAEADESDASFLYLSPVMAVITNIDADHMDTYGHDFNKLTQAFVDFAQRLPFYGTLYACADDAHVRDVLPRITKPIVTYGIEHDAHIRARNVRAVAGQMSFEVQRSGFVAFEVTLNLAGVHNVLNALSAIAIAQDLDVPTAQIQSALAQFQGVGRRFQRYGEVQTKAGRFTLIDDYGHHPVEMAATLAAVRGAFPQRRVLLAFQPHRFSRTRDLFEDFVRVMGTADAVLLGEVYPAGEAAIVAADGRALARALRVSGKVDPVFVEVIDELPAAILSHARDQDVVITMGAGSIGQVAARTVSLAQGALQ
jgi:UDP-N-acetylmuramate--alanine ligase